MQTMSTRTASQGRLVVPVSFVYLSFFLVGLIVIEMALPRIADRRVNFPVFFALVLPLFFIAVRNVLQTGFHKVRLFSIVILTYAFWCALTALWSTSKMESLMHATILIFSIVLAQGAAQYDAKDTVMMFAKICLMVFFASWVALAIAPTYALEHKGIWRLCGVMGHEFRLGYLCASCLIFCLIWFCIPDQRMKPSFYFLVLLGLVAGLTLLATQTRTLFLYTFFCLCVVGVMHLRGWMRVAFITVLVLSVILLGIFSDEIMQAMSRGEADGSLSGRTVVWEKTMAMVPEAFMKGHGFASFDDEAFDAAWPGYRPPHAHNTWIMSLFETGLVGTVLISIALFLLLVQSYRLSARLGRPSYAFYITLLSLLAGLTGLIYGGKMSTLMGLSFVLFYQENMERVRLSRPSESTP